MYTFTNKFVGLMRSWLYWQVINKLRGTFIEGTGVSPRANIGRHVIVRRGSELGPDVSIGDFSYISGPRTYIEAARIGKFCSIARQVVIGPSEHDLSAVTTHPFPISPAYGKLATVLRSQPQKRPPVIGNDVWIGINVVVLRGVTIGDGAVIGANSVVTRDVAPFTIVGGSPARELKHRFSPEIAKSIQKIRWWDWSDQKLADRLGDFGSPAKFVEKYRDSSS